MKLIKLPLVLLPLILSSCTPIIDDTDPGYYGEENIVSNLSAKGIDGNDYTQDLFKGKITLLNKWGVECPPCIKELPYLEAIHQKYKDKNFQVVGVVADVTDESYVVDPAYVTRANQIALNTGVTYVNLIPAPTLGKFINISDANPQTIFIDENGNRISETYMGSREADDWDSLVKTILEKYINE